MTRAPKGSLGTLKMVSFKLPVNMIDKLDRLSIARKTNKTALVREAINSIEE